MGLYGKVQEALRLEGLASVRVKESDFPQLRFFASLKDSEVAPLLVCAGKHVSLGEVSVLSKMPERLKMQLHEEMHMPLVMALGFWPDPEPDHHYFYSSMCHTCIVEDVCTQLQDVFMPGTDCKHVLVIETGLMHYYARNQAGVLTRNQEVQNEDVLCLPCLWADWHHRGRLTASTGTCYYGKINADEPPASDIL